MAHLLTAYLAFHYLNGKLGGQVPQAIKELKPSSYSQFFHVTWSDDQREWIIKQYLCQNYDKSFDISNEGAVNQKMSSVRKIAEYVPKFISYDSLHRILITEYSKDYISLSKTTESLSTDELAMRVAMMMANTHFHLTNAAIDRVDELAWYHYKPSILVNNIAYFKSILQNERHTFVRRNWLRELIVESTLDKILFSFNRSWTSNKIIHGDAHWANILLNASGKTINGLQLCDWEFAGWGDEIWDFACFFQGFLDMYMNARIGHSGLIRAGEQFYQIYTNKFKTFESKAQTPEHFEIWCSNVLRLSAIGFLQKLLKLDQSHTGFSEDIIEPERARIEFLLKGVITNSNPFKSF